MPSESLSVPSAHCFAAGGGVVSTVKVREAGVASVLVASSVALTSKVCSPSERFENAFGESQVTHAPASSLHKPD